MKNKPHNTSHDGRSFELVVHERPHANPITPAQVQENRTPRPLRGPFPTIKARTYDAAQAKAREALEAKGFVVRSMSFAAGNKIAAVVQREEAPAKLPFAHKRRR